MLSSGLAIIVLVLCSASCGDDPPGQPPPTRTPAEKLRGLSADFDRETQAANAQRGTRPDPAAAQAYARRFLHLARECPDESVAVDALIWVLRHDRNGPLVKEAIALVETRYLRSDRLRDLCWLLLSQRTSGVGEPILRRILAENPHPKVRGWACLCLGFYQGRLAEELRGMNAAGPTRLEAWVKAVGPARVPHPQLRSLDPEQLDREADQLLARAMVDYGDLLDHEDVTLVCSWAIGSAVPTAETILRHIAETHRDPSLRSLARWDLASRLVQGARLVAEVQTTPRDLQQRLIQSLGRDRFDRLMNEDASSSLARLERLLQRLAEEDAANPPYAGAFHLFSLLSMEAGYHRNVDLLLDRVEQTAGDRKVRALASYHRGLLLAGLADEVDRWKITAPEDLGEWYTRLGRDRVEELSKQDPVALQREAEHRLERIAQDYADITGWVEQANRSLVKLHNKLKSQLKGSLAPDIDGIDIEGAPLRLSAYRGRVVLLVFWSTTCAPCMRMVPFEQALVKRLENQPFALLGFNGDADETQLKTILHEQGITWRSWWMSGEAFSTVARIWSPEGVPTLYAIDRRGIVRYKFLGFPGAATIDRLVDGLLKEREHPEGLQ